MVLTWLFQVDVSKTPGDLVVSCATLRYLNPAHENLYNFFIIFLKNHCIDVAPWSRKEPALKVFMLAYFVCVWTMAETTQRPLQHRYL